MAAQSELRLATYVKSSSAVRYRQQGTAGGGSDDHPDLRLTPRQAEVLMQKVLGIYVRQARDLYNSKVAGHFSDLTPAQQTVFVDRVYNSNKTINAAFNAFVAKGDWKGAQNYLSSQAKDKSNSAALRVRLSAEAKLLEE